MSNIPGFLTHYYEKHFGPFNSLTRLDPLEAERVQSLIIDRGDVFAPCRTSDYLKKRRHVEQWMYESFTSAGGIAESRTPHYLILGDCEWLLQWYRECSTLRIDLNEIDLSKVSFTYGDSFPNYYFEDDRAYRKKVFFWEEIVKCIENYGLPQEWNSDGSGGPERYIEAQVWYDDFIKR